MGNLSGNLLNSQGQVVIDADNPDFGLPFSGGTMTGDIVMGGSGATTSGSVEFDGNGDYLTVPGPGTLAASSNWTLECYFYCTGTSSGTYRIVGANESVNESQYSFIRIRNGQYQFFTDNAYSNTVGTATFNAWHHIAFTKTGTTLRGFVDGVKIYEATDNNSDTITTLVVGWGYGSEYFPGYISNVRFVNGTSLYTSNFTPPTEELTSVSNTILLACQSSSSATAEATGKTITAFGNVSSSTESPGLTSSGGSNATIGVDGDATFAGTVNATYFIGDLSGKLLNSQGQVVIDADNPDFGFDGNLTGDLDVTGNASFGGNVLSLGVTPEVLAFWSYQSIKNWCWWRYFKSNKQQNY